MDLISRAQRLVDQLSVAQQVFGSMTVAVYDTAWVSMITKPTASGRRWLYPQCFEFILDQQKPDGAWESYAADVDGILNTAASLLACTMHKDHPLQMRSPPMHRTSNAVARGQQALQRQLDRWDVSATVHVGFEYLVPCLLQQLAERGMEFQFPGRASLMALMQSKMGKFSPAFLYSDYKSTALHSLEAFVGKIDFDRVRHHKHSGSFMASPSSTAAYLMNVSQWDDESEAYLDFVLANGAGKRSGGVPSAFPSTYFEATWALTTLFKNGFTSQDLGAQRILDLTALLTDALDQNGGVLGFAPSIQADVDDTAKALTSLSCMGVQYPARAMLASFEGDSHFRTYPGERDPSFSANCNALVALTSQSDLTGLAVSVEKAAKFLCNAWWETDGWIKDKWASAFSAREAAGD